MCLSVTGRIVSISPDGTAEVLTDDGRSATVSLAVLSVEGTPVAAGDWLLVQTGLAVERLDPADAAEIVEWRRAVRAAGEAG